MNRVALWILAQIFFLISAQAVPPVLNYAGQVSVNGEAFDGNGLFKFALVNADGTTTYWSNDGTSVDGSEPQASVAVAVNGGLYAILLGNTAQSGMGAIDPAVFTQHTDAKLRVWFSDGVNEFQQLSPDRPFASVPYAFTAGTAQTAGSAPIANGAVNLDMLSQDVKTQINATIGLERLSSEIISKLEQNATITNGSVTGSKMAEGSVSKSALDATLLKYLKPEITSKPQAQTVYSYSNVSYSVTAEGKYLSYQWKKDGVNLTGETNATLTITDANATLHDGNYSIVVSNDFGSLESPEIPVDVNTTWSTDGLVGWWKFDEGSGTIAYDSSGNGNDGDLTNGPTWMDGKIGGALSFDGVDDYVEIENYYGIPGTNPRTTSVWLKNNFQSSSKHRPFISWGSKSTGKEWKLFFDVEGKIKHNIWGGSVTGSTIVDSNRWIHVVSVLPIGATNTLSMVLYLNGHLENLQIANGTFNTGSDFPVRIGNDLHFNIYKGLIDDVRIYDRALSAEEVQALYYLGQ